MRKTFDIDELPRRGKQHSAVQQMFGEQPDAIHRLSVLQQGIPLTIYITTD